MEVYYRLSGIKSSDKICGSRLATYRKWQVSIWHCSVHIQCHTRIRTPRHTHRRADTHTDAHTATRTHIDTLAHTHADALTHARPLSHTHTHSHTHTRTHGAYSDAASVSVRWPITDNCFIQSQLFTRLTVLYV